MVKSYCNCIHRRKVVGRWFDTRWLHVSTIPRFTIFSYEQCKNPVTYTGSSFFVFLNYIATIYKPYRTFYVPNRERDITRYKCKVLAPPPGNFSRYQYIFIFMAKLLNVIPLSFLVSNFRLFTKVSVLLPKKKIHTVYNF